MIISLYYKYVHTLYVQYTLFSIHTTYIINIYSSMVHSQKKSAEKLSLGLFPFKSYIFGPFYPEKERIGIFKVYITLGSLRSSN